MFVRSDSGLWLNQGGWQGAGWSRAVAVGGGNPASDFLARTSGLSATYQTAYTNMINGLVSDGVWSKLDVLYVFATADTITAKLNLIQNAYNATAPSGDPTFTAGAGYQNPTTKYLDSGFNASTAAVPKYVQNSACMFNWNALILGDDGANIGLVSGGNNDFVNRNTSGQLSIRINATAAITIANVDASGLILTNRTTSSNVDVYQNSAVLSAGNSSTSAAVQNSNMTFFTGTSFNINSQLKFGGWGSQLTATDVTNLYTRMVAFLAATTMKWNSGDRITTSLTNNDLSATDNAGSSSPFTQVRATKSISTSKKYYFEIVINTVVGGPSPGTQFIGLCPSSHTLGASLIASADAIGLRDDQPSWLINFVNKGTSAGPFGVAGTVVGVAVDGTNKTCWNTLDGTAWNGSGTNSPATNVGGADLSTLTFPLFPTWSSASFTQKVTARFDSGFTLATPGSGALAGFSVWGS
jgi:hypothetical protein